MKLDKVLLGAVVLFIGMMLYSDIVGRDNPLTDNQKRLLYKNMTVEQHDKILNSIND